MKLIYLFFIFFSSLFYAQNDIVIDSLFTEADLLSIVNYHYDIDNKEDIYSIELKEFLPFKKKFPGVKNVKFWFQFNLKNNLDKQQEIVLKIKTHTISNLKIYEIVDSVKNIYEFNNSFKKKNT